MKTFEEKEVERIISRALRGQSKQKTSESELREIAPADSYHFI